MSGSAGDDVCAKAMVQAMLNAGACNPASEIKESVWKRLFVPCRVAGKLPMPVVRSAVPLTNAAPSDAILGATDEWTLSSETRYARSQTCW